MKKVLVLVLSYDGYPYDMLEECIRTTWGKFKHPNVEIFYSHGNGNEFSIENDVIRAPFSEGYPTIGHKTLAAFEYFLKKDFDYVFRPNSSSFVNFEKLLEFLNDSPSERYYSGVPISYENGGVTQEDRRNGPVYCCSGCGYILSRDLVEIIVKEKNNWSHRLIDDLALCKLLHEQGVSMVESPRLKVVYTKNGEVYSLNKILTRDEIMDNFHITVRANESQIKVDHYREHNCELIKTLYKIVYEN